MVGHFRSVRPNMGSAFLKSELDLQVLSLYLSYTCCAECVYNSRTGRRGPLEFTILMPSFVFAGITSMAD